MSKKILLWVFVLGIFTPVAVFAAEGCRVNQIVGQPLVERDGVTIPLNANDKLNKGDKLKTDANCQVDMSMNDLAGCRILAQSQVEVKGWKPESMSLSVNQGNVILNLKKLPQESSFTLETPTAVASVRGTQFWGRVESSTPDNPLTTFAVREGRVNVTDKLSSQSFQLDKGQALDLPKTANKAPVVRQAMPEEMQAMQQADEIKSDADGGLIPLLR